MTPEPPPYPMTMTPPSNTPLTAEAIQRVYGSQPVDARLRLVLQAQGEILRAWDTFEGGPSVAREGAKEAIAKLLSR